MAGDLINVSKKSFVELITDFSKRERIQAQVVSDSMHPFIKKGQMISFIRIAFHTISIGDVIVFTKGRRHKIIAHRVVGTLRTRHGKGYLTKGDNCIEKDGFVVYKEDLVGKVIS